MANLFQKLLGMSSEVTQRGSTMAKKVDPEVIGKGTSKVAKEAADEIPEAAFKEITPTTGMDDMSWLNRMDPRLKAFAKGGTAGAGAGYIASELYPPGEESKPSHEPIKAVEPKKIEELAHEAKQTVKTEAPKLDGLDADALIKEEKDSPQAQHPVDNGVDFNKILEQGIEEKKQSLRDAALLRASERLGAGFARITPDHGSSDVLRQQADQGLEDAKNRIGVHREQMSFEKAKDEMQDQSKMRDPESEISKRYTDIAIQAGILKPGQKATAQSLEKFGLGTLLSTIEAGKSRRDATSLARETKIEEKKQSDKFKAQSSVDKQINQLYNSDDYKAYNNSKDAQSGLNAAISSGDKTEAGSAFMMFGKVAQGDESVLRDGDMRVLAGDYNYTSPSEMIAKLAAKARGGNFNESELKQMKLVAERVQALKGERVKQLMSPILQRANAHELNLAESIDPNKVSEFFGQEKSGLANNSTEKGETKVFNQEITPGYTVTTKSGKRYKIGPDGRTGTLIGQ